METLGAPQSELRAERARRDSLQDLFGERAVSSEKKKRVAQLNYLSSLDDTYVCTASTILRTIGKLKGLQWSKLDIFQGTLKRRWDLRADLELVLQIVLSEEIRIAPLPGHFHISFEKLYTPSFGNGVKSLRPDVSNVLLKESWWWICAGEIEKRLGTDALVLDETLWSGLRYSISDGVSGGKWKAPGTTFIASGYDCLQSPYVAHTDGQKRDRKLQKREPKNRPLTESPVCYVIFNYWWCSDLRNLRIPGGRCSAVDITE